MAQMVDLKKQIEDFLDNLTIPCYKKNTIYPLSRNPLPPLADHG